MITVIDYGAGNLFSVRKALEYFGAKVIVSDISNDILNAKGLILPGVGAFGWGMKLLEEKDLCGAIRGAVDRGVPLLGVCLGLQLLFEESEESPEVKGLGIIKGKVKKLPSDLPLPHIGWNQVKILRNIPIFKGIKSESFFYFVHSYYGEPIDEGLVCGETDYGITFPSVIWQNNIFAVQFHPEKSSKEGLKIYKNFLDIVYGDNTSY
ncbi:MAG: imidazole glycerol phosphate synthase subunit HisH [bacterium]|nr:imidazole glycerol phosphate synthase subunit HisH [bacterium]